MHLRKELFGVQKRDQGQKKECYHYLKQIITSEGFSYERALEKGVGLLHLQVGI